MAKLIVVLLIGLLLEAVGVVLLKTGINQIGSIQQISVSEVIRVFKAGIVSPGILGGVFFEALFFGCLLYLMSQADVSFVWPMTALSFVFTTIAARMVLNETVSGARWIGVLMIVIGAGLISWSEAKKQSPVSPTVAATPPEHR
jgi:drug/metabolite transporter (DMT)-like permease